MSSTFSSIIQICGFSWAIRQVHWSYSSFPRLPLLPCRSSYWGHFDTTEPFTRSCLREWFCVNAHLWICPQLTRLSHGAAWESGVDSGNVERRAEDRQRGELTSHCGDPGSSHQTAHWFQMLYPCCIVTHTCTQAGYLPLVLDFHITSGHSWPLIPHCCSSQMIGRFRTELESPLP